MGDQDYNYPPPSFGQGYGQQNNYDDDYQNERSDNYRGGGGGYNKGGNFGSNRGGFNKGNDNMVVQDDTVFVSGMDVEVTESEINTHFGAIGIIKKDKRTNKPKIWIYRDKESGKGKGECTITYDDPAAASGAIQWFDGKDFNGNIIKVQLAQRNNTWQKGGPKKTFGSGGGDRGGDRRGGGGYSSGPPRDERGPRSFGGQNSGGKPGSGGGQHRDGDWICSECSNKNFAWRKECNRCNAPKSDDGNGSSRGGSGGRFGGSGGGPNRSDDRGDRGGRNFSRGGMRGGERSSGGGGGGFNRQRPY
ncbi:RNA-binding protein cabeza-like isoform X2 [Chironomus tepperi]|uniref:RNA-binding protein cabeza-like isoform X2 n=1 Tax=Chironomus tepperi TaxID=113505 RepID=UPI00391F6DE8